MKIYEFEAIDDALDMVTMAGRRTLDAAGRKLSLAAWRKLSLETRNVLTSLGSERKLDITRARELLDEEGAKFETIDPPEEPPIGKPPSDLIYELDSSRDLDVVTWRAMSGLDRYALARVATQGRSERLKRAFDEITGRKPRPSRAPKNSLPPVRQSALPQRPTVRPLVRARRSAAPAIPAPALASSEARASKGPASISNHINARGEAHMVDVGAKEITARQAVARARVNMNPSTFARVVSGETKKGDVLATARIAGIQAAKRTSELIPLCHIVALTKIEVMIELVDRGITIDARVEAMDRTGVEMEAMVAASTAALTVYDMLKGIDRTISFEVALLTKAGGKTGAWNRAMTQ